MSTPKSQGLSGSGSYMFKSTCVRYGKKHSGKCLANTKGCYGCGKSDHKMRHCLVRKITRKERNKIRSDARQDRVEQEYPSNVATGMCFMLTSIPVILVFLS